MGFVFLYLKESNFPTLNAGQTPTEIIKEELSEELEIEEEVIKEVKVPLVKTSGFSKGSSSTAVIGISIFPLAIFCLYF